MVVLRPRFRRARPARRAWWARRFRRGWWSGRGRRAWWSGRGRRSGAPAATALFVLLALLPAALVAGPVAPVVADTVRSAEQAQLAAVGASIAWRVSRGKLA